MDYNTTEINFICSVADLEGNVQSQNEVIETTPVKQHDNVENQDEGLETTPVKPSPQTGVMKLIFLFVCDWNSMLQYVLIYIFCLQWFHVGLFLSFRLFLTETGPS